MTALEWKATHLQQKTYPLPSDQIRIFQQPKFLWDNGSISLSKRYILGKIGVVWGRELIWPAYMIVW